MIGINLQFITGFRTRDFTGPGSRDPFVTVQVVTAGGTADIFLHTPAQCDELIKAAVEAKRLLSPPQPDAFVMVYGDCNCGHDEDAHYLRQPEGDRGHCGATHCLCPLFDGAAHAASHA